MPVGVDPLGQRRFDRIPHLDPQRALDAFGRLAGGTDAERVRAAAAGSVPPPTSISTSWCTTRTSRQPAPSSRLVTTSGSLSEKGPPATGIMSGSCPAASRTATAAASGTSKRSLRSRRSHTVDAEAARRSGEVGEVGERRRRVIEEHHAEPGDHDVEQVGRRPGRRIGLDVADRRGALDLWGGIECGGDHVGGHVDPGDRALWSDDLGRCRVVGPVPQPTSSTRSPGRRPVAAISSSVIGASCRSSRSAIATHRSTRAPAHAPDSVPPGPQPWRRTYRPVNRAPERIT